MKKILLNEDGTLKVVNVIIFVDVIATVILLFMVQFIYGSLNDTTIKKTTTTTKSTTTMDLCNGCDLSFNRDIFDVNPKKIYLLEEILNYENINTKYIKFDISDEKLAKITSKDGKVALETLDTIGAFTLTASYYSKTDSIEVKINSDKMIDIEIDKNIYYIKVGDKEKINYEIIPKGFKDKDLSIEVEDTTLAELDNDGNIIGKMVGKTNLTISSKDITKVIPIYIVNSNIDIMVKNAYSYKKSDIADYTKNKDIEILLVLENTNYSNNDVTYEVIPEVDMDISLEYKNKNSKYPNAYEYALKIKSNIEDKTYTEGGATIIFALPDGSKHELKINQEDN